MLHNVFVRSNDVTETGWVPNNRIAMEGNRLIDISLYSLIKYIMPK